MDLSGSTCTFQKVAKEHPPNVKGRSLLDQFISIIAVLFQKDPVIQVDLVADLLVKFGMELSAEQVLFAVDVCLDSAMRVRGPEYLILQAVQ